MPGSDERPSGGRHKGRPRDPARCRRILEAADAHFSAHGFTGANLDAIAAAAGVSKMTVYSHFASKEDLFEAVLRERTDQAMGGLDRDQVLDPEAPEQALLAFGERFLALVREAHVIGKFRSVYGAAGVQPQACQAFYRQGPDRLIGELADYLRQAHDTWALRVADPRLAADLFLAMFLGSGHIRGLIRLDLPDAAENRALLKEAVRVFLAAYLNRGGCGAS